METLSYILSLVALFAAGISYFDKSNKIAKILLLVFISNLTISISYFVIGNFAGSLPSIIALVEVTINFIFDKKGKKLPTWLILLYALAFLISGIAVFSVWADIFAILATMFFVLSIVQNTGFLYKLFTLFNASSWILFDIFTKAYGPLITHVSIFVLVTCGMIYAHFVGKKNNKCENVDNIADDGSEKNCQEN